MKQFELLPEQLTLRLPEKQAPRAVLVYQAPKRDPLKCPRSRGTSFHRCEECIQCEP